MKKMYTRGFTLIELLVVIAIIGILAAVVIGSLNDARSSGQNASIQQSMANIRSQAELFYNSGGYTYSGVCLDARITSLRSASLDVINGTFASTSDLADLDNGDTSAERVGGCEDGDTYYVVASPLADPGADNEDFWCVDSTGFSGYVQTPPATGALSCP